MPIDPDPEPSDFTPLPRPLPFGMRVRNAIAGFKAFVADAWSAFKAEADDDIPIIADYVYNDVTAYIKTHGLQAAAFNHSGAAKSITLQILSESSHVASMLVSHLPAAEQREVVVVAVEEALKYLANIGVAGPNTAVPPVAGKIEPKPDGPGRAA